MQEHPEVDVVTVGTGWTAAIIAQQMADAGLQVVSLERGGARWTWPDFAHNHDYLRYAQRNAMMQDLSKESWTWRPNPGVPALPFREHGGHQLGQGLGGAGAHWAAESWRFQPEDFHYRSHHLDRYGADKLPEGNAIHDWPVSYEELEPFYDRFEYDVGVSGRAGNIGGQIVPGGNPFEGWRSRPFPLPPLATMSFGELFIEAIADNFDHSDLDFIGGGRISDAGGEADPIGIVGDIPWLGGQDEARQWGRQFKDAMPAAYNSTTVLVVHAEDMSFESKFMDLDPTYTDALGLPLLRLTYDWSDNERNMYRYLAARAEEIMLAMGADEIAVVDELPGYMISQGPTHPTGGAIMGTDPSNSVCNKYGQVWDAPNLFVTGAAQFPQNPGANPTETICALAYYTADAVQNGYLHRPEELMT